MIPSPDEFFSDWWRNSGYDETGYEDVFYHDVPPALAAEARRRERNESSKALKEPWPLSAWPETPTRYLLCRDDRMFPAAWARRHAHQRLGIEADQIDGGHYISSAGRASLPSTSTFTPPSCGDGSRHGAASRRAPRACGGVVHHVMAHERRLIPLTARRAPPPWPPVAETGYSNACSR